MCSVKDSLLLNNLILILYVGINIELIKQNKHKKYIVQEIVLTTTYYLTIVYNILLITSLHRLDFVLRDANGR